MLSPFMHNAVVWGKSIPADPIGVLSGMAYFKGNAARKDPVLMREAIQNGLDPIGRHNATQADILGIADLKDHGDGTLQKLGNFWHGTLLWDRVADLQMHLYQHIKAQAVEHGLDDGAAGKLAAHFANLYAGNLPMESMSKGARFLANMTLFSRSFTLGNLAVYKSAVSGLPSEIQAQITRDSGMGQNLLAQGLARRKAASALVMDVALQHIGLGLAAHAAFFIAKALFGQNQAVTPNPGNDAQSWLWPKTSEPGKEGRVLIGHQSDGTGIYVRLPTGKFAEEMVNWIVKPGSTLDAKLSPFAKWGLEVASNNSAPGTPFGHAIFTRDAHDLPTEAANIGKVVWAFAGGVVPSWLVEGLGNTVLPKPLRAELAPVAAALGYDFGEDGRLAALQAVLPMTGITVSKGAPGGPQMGVYYDAKDAHEAAQAEAMKGVKAQIRLGDTADARKTMAGLHMTARQQASIIRGATDPSSRLSGRARADFMRYATPAQKTALAQAEAARRSLVPADPYAPP
ncbi:MAG: hypothetical protein JOZ27_04705 [Caulobacteraceae bacterium]|nr:hypothetical protein [Caulobacteraceae bacterium]